MRTKFETVIFGNRFHLKWLDIDFHSFNPCFLEYLTGASRVNHEVGEWSITVHSIHFIFKRRQFEDQIIVEKQLLLEPNSRKNLNSNEASIQTKIKEQVVN